MRVKTSPLFFLPFILLLVISSCSFSPRINAPAGTPFRPPTLLPPTPLPTATLVKTVIGLGQGTPNAACVDGLTFLSDLTIEDGTVVEPGSSLDKRWQVRNSGSCNWEEGYTLQLVAGEAYGANPEQALVPARAGSDATIRIVFTAPEEEGDYRSAWSAVNKQGLPFGDPIFIVFIVEAKTAE